MFLFKILFFISDRILFNKQTRMIFGYKRYIPPIELITIDLKRAEQAVSSLLGDKQQQEYQPKTITTQNRTRMHYVPLFPTEAFGPNNPLLLANVSGLSFCIDIYIYHRIYSHLRIAAFRKSSFTS